MSDLIAKTNGSEIAVVGMSGRFPGAANIKAFWENLKNGVESISFFSHQELAELDGGSELLKNTDYVKARGGVLEDKEFFDPAFFGYSPREAEIMDPQTRIFHECAWHALEEAGYDPGKYDGLIGLYAGAGSSTYWESLTLLSGKCEELGYFASGHLNNKDFLTTQIAYKINLKGPAFSVQTACSTSLVAIHLACQGILNGECNMALAGGISVGTWENKGYIYQEGMIHSPDGHCRAFDAEGKGIIGGEGAGIVLLKPLEDALKDGDHIYALIKGTAINNDGLRKVGYTAPSIEGQAEVIRTAQQMAEVDPESIGYIEAHGTATPMGDPVEIAALKLAFNTGEKNYCGIGSVKTNIGHLDAAAGAAGFIKTVLALKNKLIPPSLHFREPNPKIDFKNSPFYVNSKLSEWKSNGYPLRAGVSSFGLGGTNAHVILEEAPPQEECATGRKWKILVFSAKTATALDRLTEDFAGYLKNYPGINFADATYTLQVGRKAFPHRRMVVCSSLNETIEALTTPELGKVHSYILKHDTPSVVFMFSGQGSQYVNMGLDLYQAEPMFREEIDRYFEILKSLMDYDIKEILYPGDSVSKVSMVSEVIGEDSTGNSPLERGAPEGRGVSQPDINQTEIAQPVLFIIEYALAKLLMKWGITPDAMIGHSIGEYVAACLAGVFSLEDALKLVVLRGRLMQKMPGGKMLSIPLSEEKLQPLLSENISLAAVNSPSHCVVSGEEEAINLFDKKLRKMGYETTYLHTSHAFHSKTMDPILQEFEKELSQIQLNSPKIPYVSNLSGDWISASEATGPGYWTKHLRRTVRFADGIKELQTKENPIFIEVGPGKALSTFVRQHEDKKTGQFIVNLVRHPKEKISDVCFLLSKISQLWLYGIKIDWPEFYSKEKRHRIPLPTYPFERQLFPIEGNLLKIGAEILSNQFTYQKNPDMNEWFYIPVWEQSFPMVNHYGKKRGCDNWLLFIDDWGLGTQLVKRLQKDEQSVVVVKAGAQYEKLNNLHFFINPGNIDEYGILLDNLQELNIIPNRIIHLWNISENNMIKSGCDEIEASLDLGLYSLMYIVQAVGRHRINDDIQMLAITNNMHDVTGEEELSPLKATVLGPIKIIPLEYPNISCRCVDIVLPGPGNTSGNRLLDHLLEEFGIDSPEIVVAYRGNHRWVQKIKHHRLEKSKRPIQRLKEGGTYLVTGGFGGMGFTIAEDLAKRLKAKLVLVGRSAFPARKEWQKWLSVHVDEDKISVKIRKILECEQMGAEIMVASADVSSEERMKDVIAKAEKRFGKINGIIHTAGLADYEGVIQKRTRQMTEKIIAPKVKGTIVLDRIFKDKKLDFFALFSSLGNFLYRGKSGEVGYNAANEFLDAFAYYKSKKDEVFYVSINWTDWREVGMWVEAQRVRLAKGNNEIDYNSILQAALSPSEGIEVFKLILEHGLIHIAISTWNLVNILEQIDKENGTEEMQGLEKIQSSTLLDRPSYISTQYIAPRNEIEEKIAYIWVKFFGLQRVGIHDDFFELGGDSLKAIAIISQIWKIGYKLSLNDILEHPTVHGLAAIICGKSVSKELAANIYEESILSKLECIEKLNKGGNEKNIFIIHPLHGMVNQYKELAEVLVTDYNVYGIQARGVIPGSKMSESPGELINDYVEQILKVQPEGPFIIGGYCTGVMFGYCIILELERRNHNVERFILFDSSAFLSSQYIKILKLLEYLPGFVKKAILFINKKLFLKEKLRKELNEDRSKIDDTIDIPGFPRVSKRLYDHIFLLGDYILPLEIMKSPILQLRAKAGSHTAFTEEDYSRMSKSKATLIEIPGDHNSIFAKPYVDRLAEALLENV